MKSSSTEELAEVVRYSREELGRLAAPDAEKYEKALDDYFHARFAVAVAPACEYIDTVKDALCLADVDVFMHVRRLLTERP